MTAPDENGWRPTETGVDWADGGEIELRFADGRVIRADLQIDELFTGEDEIPIPYVDAGETSFFEAEAWRPAPKESKE